MASSGVPLSGEAGSPLPIKGDRAVQLLLNRSMDVTRAHLTACFSHHSDDSLTYRAEPTASGPDDLLAAWRGVQGLCLFYDL